jgi:ParB family chromosome partitioning protein
MIYSIDILGRIDNVNTSDNVFIEADVSKLKTYARHAYKVFQGKQLEDMIEDIKTNGLLQPILVRPIKNKEFEYEIIVGHNRVAAYKQMEIDKILAQVKIMTDDESDIAMVASNSMRRHEILPSEKGRAYKAYLEAHKRQGKRSDLHGLTSGRIGHKSTRGELAILYDETETQIRRYIDLLKLIPELLDLVDEGRLALNPAVNISVLNQKEQKIVLKRIKDNPKRLTVAVSTRLRDTKAREKVELTDSVIEPIFNSAVDSNTSRVVSLKLPAEVMSEHFNDDEQDNDKMLEKIKRALELLKVSEASK